MRRFQPPKPFAFLRLDAPLQAADSKGKRYSAAVSIPRASPPARMS